MKKLWKVEVQASGADLGVWEADSWHDALTEVGFTEEEIEAQEYNECPGNKIFCYQVIRFVASNDHHGTKVTLYPEALEGGGDVKAMIYLDEYERMLSDLCNVIGCYCNDEMTTSHHLVHRTNWIEVVEKN
jgi:hypothetical protein